jgi:hypothetical protein
MGCVNNDAWENKPIYFDSAIIILKTTTINGSVLATSPFPINRCIGDDQNYPPSFLFEDCGGFTEDSIPNGKSLKQNLLDNNITFCEYDRDCCCQENNTLDVIINYSDYNFNTNYTYTYTEFNDYTLTSDFITVDQKWNLDVRKKICSVCDFKPIEDHFQNQNINKTIDLVKNNVPICQGIDTVDKWLNQDINVRLERSHWKMPTNWNPWNEKYSLFNSAIDSESQMTCNSTEYRYVSNSTLIEISLISKIDRNGNISSGSNLVNYNQLYGGNIDDYESIFGCYCEKLPTDVDSIGNTTICYYSNPSFYFVWDSLSKFEDVNYPYIINSDGSLGIDEFFISNWFFRDAQLFNQSSNIPQNILEPTPNNLGNISCLYSYDLCGVCGGNNCSCSDCSKNIWPTIPIIFDQCGICGGSNLCVDCSNKPFGKSTTDICGVCNGNGTECRIGCDGKPYSNRTYDACHVCGGNNSTCTDCCGVIHGTCKIDKCGVCNGNNNCTDCAGIPGGPFVLDKCGVCGGLNSCLDCLGVVNGTAKRDKCNVCNGNNTEIDCFGVCFGPAILDDCGVCNGKNLEKDCAGVCYGNSTKDLCGVCNGNNTCLDCLGVPFGPAKIDDCGICNGKNLEKDCLGVCFGDAVLDLCGVCQGDNTTCIRCGEVNGPLLNICGECGTGITNCLLYALIILAIIIFILFILSLTSIKKDN